MKSGSMSSFEAARNIEDAIDGYDNESYHAHIRAAALACHCCPVCCSPPCDGCLAGGVCDDAACRCDELDEYRREDSGDGAEAAPSL